MTRNDKSWQDLSQPWHYVEKWAEEKPEAEAFVFAGQRLGWSELKKKVDQTAKVFLEAGVERGDRVALISMARLEFPITYMATLKVGAMWMGLSPKYTVDELRYMIQDSRPKVLVSLRKYLETDLRGNLEILMKEFPFIKKVLIIGEPFPGTEEFEQFAFRPRNEWDEALESRSAQIDVDDDALLLYTSGSTGKPKGVVHSHKSIITNIKMQNEKFYFKPESRGICPFPINHVASCTEMLISSIMAGGCLVMMDVYDPVALLKIVGKEKITQFAQPPVLYLMEMKLPEFKQMDWSYVKIFLFAGAAAPKMMVDVLNDICQKTGAVMLTGYGSTETCGFITYSEKGDDLETLMKTAGKIAPPFELKIVDDQRREVQRGEVGEIAVRGDFLMKRYLNKPEETAKVVDEKGWHYTSDLAYQDERGYITITGRKSEMFKTGAENVFPLEIEGVLETHPSVLFAAVLGVPDEIYQEVGWAFVMLKPGQTTTQEELRALCKSRLANFKVPKRFFIRSLLPMTLSGKVDKVSLRAEAREILKQKY